MRRAVVAATPWRGRRDGRHLPHRYARHSEGRPAPAAGTEIARTRQWFTFAVARDVYDGVPAIYVNYLDHDEAAHAFGPRSRQARAGLRAVDRSLRQIRRALRRVHEYRYDLYILADHGQASCTTYSALTGGRRFERAFFDEILAVACAFECGLASSGFSVELPAFRAAQATKASEAGPPSGVEGRLYLDFEPYLDVREVWEREGIRVVSAGPNAFVYFVDTPEPALLEAIEARCPGLPALLSKSPGVGFASKGRPRLLLARPRPSPHGSQGRPVRGTRGSSGRPA